MARKHVEPISEQDYEALVEDVRRREGRLLRILDALPVFVSYIDRDGICRFVNRHYEEWFGRPRSEIEGLHARDMLPGESYERAAPLHVRAFAGERVRYEAVLRDADGGMFYVDTRYIPDRRPDGTIEGFVSLGVDISARTEAERRRTAVLEREKAARDAAETAAARIALLQSLTSALAGAVTTAEVAEVLVERCVEAVAASSGALFVEEEGSHALRVQAARGFRPGQIAAILRSGPDDRRPVRDAIRTGISVFIPSQEDANARYPDLPEEFSRGGIPAGAVLPLGGHGDRVMGCLVFMFDQARTFERTERDFMMSLARQGAQSLERARLFHEMEEQNRAKDRFLAMLAHELRNPLTPMLAAAHILRRRDAAEHVHERARVAVERQVKHMARLIDDLLDVSRISRGKVEIRRERVDLRAMLEETFADHEEALRAAGLRFARMLPPDPVWVTGDPTRLSQIVSNLLNNAAKFTHAEGAIVARLESSEADGWATISVRDTGVGIEPATMVRIFEPFVQAETGMDRGGTGGLGLGLTVVKGLAELHGGQVSVTSQGRGSGAQFTVRLPLADVARAEERTPTSAETSSALRVLLIEDNRDSADLMQALLTTNGHEVVVAYEPREGIRMARRLRPDVVLCDLGLPEMDGFEVARALREAPETAHARLVAVTGYGSDEDRRRAREAGFLHHVTKPVDPERLELLLQELRSTRTRPG